MMHKNVKNYFFLPASVKDMVVHEAFQAKFMTHYYVGRQILGGTGCESVFFSGAWVVVS